MIKNIIRSIRNWLFGTTARVDVVAAPNIIPAQSTNVAPPVVREVNQAVSIEEEDSFPSDKITGEYYFREQILDQLDRYMYYLAKMRRSDPDAYAIYRRVGGHILPNSARLKWRDGDMVEDLNAWFSQTLPGFGCISLSSSDIDKDDIDSGRISPRFMYFQKYKRSPAGVQVTNNGAVYLVTSYFHTAKADTKSISSPLEHAIAINPDGQISVLLSKVSEHQTIRHKHGGASTVSHQRWGIPPILREWARENNHEVTAMLKQQFIVAANYFSLAQMGTVRITASKGGLSAVFAVETTRTPYFFKDRDVEVTNGTKRARIFHIRRGHIRTLASGKTIHVKTHFAGLRRFEWNGYDIHITVPGWHHADIGSFNVGAFDSATLTDTEKTFKDWTGTDSVASLLQSHIGKGWPEDYGKRRSRLRGH